jgi:hypothetical protein
MKRPSPKTFISSFHALVIWFSCIFCHWTFASIYVSSMYFFWFQFDEKASLRMLLTWCLYWELNHLLQWAKSFFTTRSIPLNDFISNQIFYLHLVCLVFFKKNMCFVLTTTFSLALPLNLTLSSHELPLRNYKIFVTFTHNQQILPKYLIFSTKWVWQTLF